MQAPKSSSRLAPRCVPAAAAAAAWLPRLLESVRASWPWPAAGRGGSSTGRQRLRCALASVCFVLRPLRACRRRRRCHRPASSPHVPLSCTWLPFPPKQCQSVDMLEKLLRAGVTCARVNLSWCGAPAGSGGESVGEAAQARGPALRQRACCRRLLPWAGGTLPCSLPMPPALHCARPPHKGPCLRPACLQACLPRLLQRPLSHRPPLSTPALPAGAPKSTTPAAWPTWLRR